MSKTSVYTQKERDNKRSDEFNETELSRAKTTSAVVSHTNLLSAGFGEVRPCWGCALYVFTPCVWFHCQLCHVGANMWQILFCKHTHRCPSWESDHVWVREALPVIKPIFRGDWQHIIILVSLSPVITRHSPWKLIQKIDSPSGDSHLICTY